MFHCYVIYIPDFFFHHLEKLSVARFPSPSMREHRMWITRNRTLLILIVLLQFF